MRWAVPASVSVHLGLIATAWLFMQWKPEELTVAESAVSIDIVSMEDAVTEPSETVSEATANLVSAGVTQAAAEPLETETVEPVEVAAAQPVTAAATRPADPVAAAAPVVEIVEPTETEDLVSAQVMTALVPAEAPVVAPIPQIIDDAAPTVAETVAPSDAPILDRLDQSAKLAELRPAAEVQEIITASIDPLTPAKPVESTEPVKIANLNPMPEPIVEEVVETPPVPAPRIVRKPVEAEQKPIEDKKPVEKKKAEKPVEKPVETKKTKQVASLGNGGEAEADSAAAKAAGGKQGKVATAGKGDISAYEGKVRAKLLKAVRKPRDSDSGDVRVMFTLDANGRVTYAALSRSSGDAKLDQAAMAAIERAAPYPKIPQGTGKSSWSFTIPIGIN